MAICMLRSCTSVGLSGDSKARTSQVKHGISDGQIKCYCICDLQNWSSCAIGMCDLPNLKTKRKRDMYHQPHRNSCNPGCGKSMCLSGVCRTEPTQCQKAVHATGAQVSPWLKALSPALPTQLIGLLSKDGSDKAVDTWCWQGLYLLQAHLTPSHLNQILQHPTAHQVSSLPPVGCVLPDGTHGCCAVLCCAVLCCAVLCCALS